MLERIAVTGETDTPDFSIDIAGQPVPLKTTFKAIVDGTNGNTYLEEVDARLIDSHILAKGSVYAPRMSKAGMSRSTSSSIRRASKICSSWPSKAPRLL